MEDCIRFFTVWFINVLCVFQFDYEVLGEASEMWSMD